MTPKALYEDLSTPAPSAEFSLYIHLPFCQSKCPYCNFFVLLPTPKKMKELCTALLSEWRQCKEMAQDHQLRSIYFGGGTPSLFPLHYFKDLLEELRPSGDVEITVEVNPEHATLSFFTGLRSLGVNRISLGVQSLQKDALMLLGRSHDLKAVQLGIQNARDAGFGNISLDLMYELPDQTAEQWGDTLLQTLSWPIQHLSFYNLTIEPKTPFYRKRQNLMQRLAPSKERALMFDMIETTIGVKQWERYEISALAKPGFESRHNSGYWRGRSYLGLGPSAHSFWNGKRWQNGRRWNDYLLAASKSIDLIRQEDLLELKERQRELFLIHLRLAKGVDLKAFQKRWGQVPYPYCRLLSFIDRKLMQLKGQVLSLTSTGRRYYDAIAVELI